MGACYDEVPKLQMSSTASVSCRSTAQATVVAGRQPYNLLDSEHIVDYLVVMEHYATC